MSTIALLGGSFDPPHVGHLANAKWVLAQPGVDEVWLLPVYRHGFGKKLESFEDRVEMTRLLVRGLSGAKVSELESQAPGTGRTVDLLEFISKKYPNHQFRFAVGTDILKDFHRWKDPERVRELAPLLVVPRAGYEKSELPEISSSKLRAALAAKEDTSEFLPDSIADYIRSHELYGVLSVKERMEQILAGLNG